MMGSRHVRFSVQPFIKIIDLRQTKCGNDYKEMLKIFFDFTCLMTEWKNEIIPGGYHIIISANPPTPPTQETFMGNLLHVKSKKSNVSHRKKLHSVPT